MSDVFDFYVYDDRSIQFKLAEPILLEDKNVTQFRFRIPKSLNGFDMSGWEWWFIFVNPNGTKYTTLLELTDDEDEPEEYSVATYTVGYGFSGIVGTVKFSIEALNVSGEEIVNEWHTKTYSTAVIDTLQGLRAVIPEPDGQVSTGITEQVKQALLQIARKVAYIDEHGQTYYDALYNALYAVLSVNISPSSITLNAIGNTSQLTAATVPEGANVTWTSSNPSVATVSDSGLVTSVAWGNATITATAGDKTATCSVTVAQASVVAITADYTQSGTVYTTASLDDLKSDLTVSAEWSDGTSSIVADTDYTLSGTLTEGTSTITVSYGGQSTTFNVTVTAPPTLQSITATYTQSGTVYDTDTLDSLKSDLVVTANYSDSTTETVTDYTLSGTLAEGTSTITVSYGGKTASFNVTVTNQNVPSGYTKYDYIYKSTSGDIKPIVTDAQLASDYTVEMRYKYPSGTNANPLSLFGTKSKQWGGSKEIALFITQSTGKLGYWYANTDTKNEIFVSADTVHSIKVLPVGKSTTYPSNAVIDVDGTEYDTGSTASGETWSAWFGIFGYAYSATNTTTGADFSQIGEIIIKDANDDVVYDFVPVSRNDNKNGFYETVNGTFYEATSMTVGNWE